jgi:hypothetical protein
MTGRLAICGNGSPCFERTVSPFTGACRWSVHAVVGGLFRAAAITTARLSLRGFARALKIGSLGAQFSRTLRAARIGAEINRWKFRHSLLKA